MIRNLLIVPLVFLILLAGCVYEAPRETGTIQFTSSPTGAQVYFDSQFRGTTPVSLTGVEPGNHAIEFRYPGYQGWSEVILVSPGSNNVFAAMIPATSGTSTIPEVATTTAPAAMPSSPVTVTIKPGKNPMLVGDSNTFTGTASGTKNIIVTIYGSGIYSSGSTSLPKDVDAFGNWAYVWNPGSKILPGTYRATATDHDKKALAQAEFEVIGNGEVTVVPSTYAASPGNTVRFSGLCTTNAPEVELVLYGPDRYAGGIGLGTVSVQANDNWVFSYTLDNTVPTGTYTMKVYDVPKTTSGSAQFTVGYSG
ncbi:PEGA domain-containing protein [Methanoregula sp.]|uniref:PEGA domain-containing protein n=1 Tax=Methanoregula sp. TaxID=2052170 RepID=UPI0026038CD9|nr:PEGA domain-containing protein [Methanoregula sp.]MDD5142565.1 PEGA domain-containing protein [Methanoregula sp.]